MHIVLANQWYPPEGGWGGVAMYNHAVAHAYRALGHEVTVVARRNDETTPAYSEADGIRIHRLLAQDHYYLRRAPILGYYSRPIQQLAYSWRLRRLIQSLQKTRPIDVVEFAEINAEGFFFARTASIPFVVRCHTPTFVQRAFFEAAESPHDTRLISACERNVIRRAHALTAPSRDMASVIAASCGIPLQQITVIPNALAAAEFAPKLDPKTNGHSSRVTVLHVGRFERFKGISVLADAVPDVAKRLPGVRFLMAGYDRPSPRGTSQQSELEGKLRRAGVRDQVEFLGAVPQKQLAALYQRADLCVVPSLLYESFSYTCAQAMAAGKPVIASRIGGIPETVEDGVTGLIVEPGNVFELAKAIVRLGLDREERLRMGRAGQAKVLSVFDPVKVAQQNLQVYEEALRRFAALD